MIGSRRLPHPPFANLYSLSRDLHHGDETCDPVNEELALRQIIQEATLLLKIKQASGDVDLYHVTEQMHTLAKAQDVIVNHKHWPIYSETVGADIKVAVCGVCQEQVGWWCPGSKPGVCEYNDEEDPAHDQCLHCGHPEERK